MRLVYRPEEQQSGYITFPLDPLLKPAGRLACSALKAILNHDRMHRLPGRQRLHHILAESRKYQNEVSTQLAEQVLAALFELLKGFEAADEESRGQLLARLTRPARPDARDLRRAAHRPDAAGLPALRRRAGDVSDRRPVRPAIIRSRACSRGWSRTRHAIPTRWISATGPGPTWWRSSAWSTAVSPTMTGTSPIRQARGDPRAARRPVRPDRFPFLEGRVGGRRARSAPLVSLPRVPDGTILRVLRNLLYLKEERLSYRSLEVEQIGSVYEAVMGYRVETATGRSVAIRPEKRHGAPVTIDLG